MRRHIVPLFAANLLAFGSVGVSYLLYSRLLDAAQFGAYAAALAVGNLAVLVLDGGVRTSIIKHPTNLDPLEESSLLSMMTAFSVVLLGLLYAGQGVVTHFYPATKNQTVFVASFAAIFLLTYPWIGLSTASLERQLQYSKLAWIESTAIVLERGAPAVFLAGTHLGLYSFVLGLLFGRLTRLILLARLHRVRWQWRLGGDLKTIRRLLGEGFAYQVAAASSLVRDNAHVIILGPMFGALWVGYYAWGFQLCTIASQAFVQISARVSLPVAAQASCFQDRWPSIILQVGLLTSATAPILAGVLLVSPVLDDRLFADKWLVALGILPLLSARMIPGIACTPVGTLLLVEKGAARFAGALWAWTVLELGFAYGAILVLGPRGMALSYAVTAWAGVFIISRAFGAASQSLFREVCTIIVRRPGLWVFVLIDIIYQYDDLILKRMPSMALVTGGLVLVVASFLVDPLLRASIIRRYH